jgi:hypothetical protein
MKGESGFSYDFSLNGTNELYAKNGDKRNMEFASGIEAA